MVASSVIVMENVSGSAGAGCDSALLDALLDDLDLPPDPFAGDDADLDDEWLWEARGCALVPAAETGRVAVRRALAADPGPVLAGCLADLDPQVLDGETRVDLIRAWQRVAGQVTIRRTAYCGSLCSPAAMTAATCSTAATTSTCRT